MLDFILLIPVNHIYLDSLCRKLFSIESVRDFGVLFQRSILHREHTCGKYSYDTRTDRPARNVIYTVCGEWLAVISTKNMPDI